MVFKLQSFLKRFSFKNDYWKKKKPLQIPDPEYKKNKINKKKFLLNDAQKNSLNYISQFNNGFSVTVLQGVTGSGKTLVYFERIKKILEQNKQVLILMPEIFLTNQFKKKDFQNFWIRALYMAFKNYSKK